MFGANIYVLNYEKNYFDPDTKMNPVLHLWSLGVEEQFYIIWPLVITFAVKKISTLKGSSFILIFTGLLFAANIFAAYQNLKWDFYFPFCRFWQMAVGGIAGYLNIKLQHKKITNLMSVTGLSSILIGIFLIDENSQFPGWWALFPTIGATLIIQAGPNTLINRYFLGFSPVRFVGKISYSLYLWHWPLLVFSRMLYPEGSSSMLSKA